MKVSAAIILEHLGGRVLAHNICKGNDPWVYCVKKHHTGCQAYNDKEICVLCESDIEDFLEFETAGVYVVSDPRGTVNDFRPVKPYMICNCSAEELLDELSVCLMKWSVFEEEMKLSLLDKQSLGEFIEMSAEFINLPLTVIDDTMKFVCRSKTQYYIDFPDYANESQSMQVPYTLLDQMTALKELNHILCHRDTFVFVSEVMYTPIIVSNFFHGDTYIGRISACDGRGEYSLADIDRVDYIRRHVEPYLVRYIFGNESSYTYNENIIRRMLLGELTDPVLINNTMSSLGIRNDSQYICIYLRLSETGLTNDLMKHFVVMLRNRFNWPIVVPFIKDVVAICPYIQSDENTQKLVVYLRDSNIRAGCSESFNGFSGLPYALEQARDAVNVGSKADCTQRLFRYKKYAQLAVVEKLAACENIESFYHPAVLFLKQYDASHGTEYFQTLRCISENRASQTDLAKKLFVHRNTLQYRLERLHELVNIDYDDPDERFRISLTYRLLDVNK